MQIDLIDILSKIVYTKTLQSVNGNSLITIPMQQLQMGLYQCIIRIDGQVEKTITIQNNIFHNLIL
jgi:hypothetical protein